MAVCDEMTIMIAVQVPVLVHRASYRSVVIGASSITCIAFASRKWLIVQPATRSLVIILAGYAQPYHQKSTTTIDPPRL
jgi:hypothetical protein